MLVVPTFSDPCYTMRCVLDGTTYVLRFDWNARAESWYLDIGLPDAEGMWLVRGMKVVSNFPLFAQHADERLPQGALIADATTSDDSNPKLDDFGPDKRVKLTYIPKDELA